MFLYLNNVVIFLKFLPSIKSIKILNKKAIILDIPLSCYEAFEKAALERTNVYRARHNAPALRVDRLVNSYAIMVSLFSVLLFKN